MVVQRASEYEATSHGVVESVAATKGVDPLDLDPLFGAINPDALDELGRNGFDGKIEFEYAGCGVTVRGNGEIQVSTNGQ